MENCQNISQYFSFDQIKAALESKAITKKTKSQTGIFEAAGFSWIFQQVIPVCEEMRVSE